MRSIKKIKIKDVLTQNSNRVRLLSWIIFSRFCQLSNRAGNGKSEIGFSLTTRSTLAKIASPDRGATGAILDLSRAAEVDLVLRFRFRE